MVLYLYFCWNGEGCSACVCVVVCVLLCVWGGGGGGGGTFSHCSDYIMHFHTKSDHFHTNCMDFLNNWSFFLKFFGKNSMKIFMIDKSKCFLYCQIGDNTVNPDMFRPLSFANLKKM